MSTKEVDKTKKGSELMPKTSPGGLLSFDEFDNFFDDFLSRRWPRLLDWNMPTLPEISLPKVDILDHDNDIEVHAALPGVKKEDLEVSVTNQTITIRSCTKEEKRRKKKANIFAGKYRAANFSAPCPCPTMSMATRRKLRSKMAY